MKKRTLVLGVSLLAMFALAATAGARSAGNAGAVYTLTNSPFGNAVAAFDRAADGTLTPAGTYATVRERTDALVNQSSTCMGCHTNVINPPGYVMENYDALGAWQTVEPVLKDPANIYKEGP